MSTVISKVQFQLDLEPALTEQFRSFKEVLAAAVYGCRIGLSGVAAHCDLSPSALSRMLNLNEDDPRHLPADLVPKIIEATQDFRPIHWLVAKYLPDAEWRHRAALTQLETLIPQLQAAAAQLKPVKR